MSERIKRLEVSQELMPFLFRTDKSGLHVSGLPDDAKFPSVMTSPDSRTFAFVIESQGFDEVEPGAVIPPLDVTYEKVAETVKFREFL